MSKNKKKTVNKTDDDDLAFLEAEAAKNASLKSNSVANELLSNTESDPPVTEKKVEVNASKIEDDEEEEDEDPTSKKDKKKKKKKPKKEETPVAAAPMSAAAKLILARKQKQAEEEARIKALQEEEDARIRAEEERIAAEEKAIEDEKERKKKAKQDKIQAQKAAGTYMTKAEKEKARKNQERLEIMRASGLIPVEGSSSPAEKTKVVYTKKKKTNGNTTEQLEEEDETKTNVNDDTTGDDVPSNNDATAAVESGGDWEDDDWESSIDTLANKAAELKIAASAAQIVEEIDEDEDLLEVERKKEQERLRLLGLERIKREEEAKIRREQEEQEREEMDRQARELAMRKETSKRKRIEREELARLQRSPDFLRAAISCIMGHVDTGKTKLLDKIRNTNVQEGEAGGITQQIGATHFPKETLAVQTNSMQALSPFEIKLPGLLVIDTPGHESFTNLRNRGSSLCDMAILVIDLMHGLEPQTIESIKMLRSKNAPFLVALNKVDRLYGWKKMPDSPIRQVLSIQDENCKLEFKDRTDRIIVQLNELGLNAKLYWENDSLEDTISLCPTSAMSGEGVPDLIMNLITFMQQRLVERLMYMNYIQCTVLEVKVIEGLGPTIDVVLLNGVIREGDRIVISTLDGPVITQVRALLTPPPNREMRIKSEYIHHQVLQGAMGVKIVAPDLQKTIAGTPLMVIHDDDFVDELMEDVQSDFASITKIQTDSKGVTVHASTLGALEALLQFLQKECKPTIPVSAVSIGTIYKKDIIRCNIMNEKGMPEYATILAFDVRIDNEAQQYADEVGVRIFTADIIYHLFDQFTAFMNNLMETRKAEAQGRAVFPAVLKIMPQHIFNKKDPIVMGVEVLEGTLKLQTPLCIPSLGLDIGRVVSIENNRKEATQAKKGTTVSIKISNESNPNLMYGRQFDHTHALYSKINRDSINALKDFFKDEVSKEDWLLINKLKKVFGVPDAKKKSSEKSEEPESS